MSDKIAEIHVALLGEDIDVWKPVNAVCISGNVYRIIEQPYDREIEAWEFEPGGEVVRKERVFSGGTDLVAASRHPDGNQDF